jgi:hypothetical protein
MISMSEDDKGEGSASVPRWTVEDVVSWLQREGFDEDICDKFKRMPSTAYSTSPRLYFAVNRATS